MKAAYYLTFDGSCFTCSTLAATIEDVAGDKLSAISNGSEQARALLRQVFPHGYEPQPYLVTVKGNTVVAVTGLKMAVQLGRLLGPHKGVRVYNLARQLGVTFRLDNGRLSVEKGGVGRAAFLKQGALFAGAVVALPQMRHKQLVNLVTADGGTATITTQPIPPDQLAQTVSSLTGSGDGQLLVEYFTRRGYAWQPEQAVGQSALVTENSGTTKVTSVAAPFAARGDRQATFRYVSYEGGSTLIGVLVAVKHGDRVTSLEAYEVRDGRVAMTQAGPISMPAAASPGQVRPDSSLQCNACQGLVILIRGVGCGIFAIGLCETGCLAGGPLAIGCAVLCPILVGIVCNQAGNPVPAYDCHRVGLC